MKEDRAMRVVYVHASKYGNGARVADEFRSRMADHDIAVETHHVDEVEPEAIPSADLYVFSSPGRMGRPIRSIRHFLKDVRRPRGTRYALLTTEMAPQPDKKTGVVPTEEEICRFQHVRPIMIEILQHKGLVKVAEEKVYVTDLKGPLEDGWQAKVDAFADAIAAMDHTGTAKAS
jgi:menaquinone-dependent protoporphyrinogen IX oxidase